MNDNTALVIFLSVFVLVLAVIVMTQIRTSRRPAEESVITTPPDLVRKPSYRYRLGARVEFRWPGLPEPMSGRVASRTIWKGYPHYRVVWDNGYASGPLDLTDHA